MDLKQLLVNAGEIILILVVAVTTIVLFREYIPWIPYATDAIASIGIADNLPTAAIVYETLRTDPLKAVGLVASVSTGLLSRSVLGLRKGQEIAGQQLSQLKQTATGIAGANEALNEQVTELTEAKGELVQQVQTVTGEKDRLAGELQAFKEEYFPLKEELNAAKATVSVVEGERDTYKHLYESLQEAIRAKEQNPLVSYQ